MNEELLQELGLLSAKIQKFEHRQKVLMDSVYQLQTITKNLTEEILPLLRKKNESIPEIRADKNNCMFNLPKEDRFKLKFN